MSVLSVFATVAMACVAVATGKASTESCDSKHPWPYAFNYLEGHKALTSTGPLMKTARSSVGFETNGNVVLRNLRSGAVLWSTSTANTGADRFGLVAGSGLCAYHSATNKTEWCTYSPATATVVLGDDCSLTVFEQAPTTGTLWTSGSTCIEAHIVPHSHDDVGWLLTPERYFDGCYTPGGGVRGIMTTVMESLQADSRRTFSEVEMYFFQRWWKEQNTTTKAAVKRLVKNGQLEFINGGWSMHDEACVHQESALSNMEVGAQFLKREFGDDLKMNIGWHIDPFGHASATPRYMAEMGFDAFFFWRTDYQHRAKMLNERTMESVWENSPSLGSKTRMFTSIMYDNYCYGCAANSCPGGFCCMSCEVMEEENDSARTAYVAEKHHPVFLAMAAQAKAPTQAQTKIGDLFRQLRFKPQFADSITVSAIADQYVQAIKTYNQGFRTGTVLMPWGCDFAHNYAHEDYSLMDSILQEIQANPKYGVTAFYSTPSRYVKAVRSMEYEWPVNKHDYFLDSDNGHAYWSGYLSSRAEYKGFERMLMNLRSAGDSLLASKKTNASKLEVRLEKQTVLREALGVAQHHDSITGTERVHVRNHYQQLLSAGMEAVHSAVSEAIGGGVHCNLANLSACPATAPLAHGMAVPMTLFNPLAQSRTEIITVPVPVASVLATSGTTVLKSQVVSTWALTTTQDNTSPAATAHPYQAYIEVVLPPLAETTVMLTAGSSKALADKPLTAATANITSDHYHVTFDPTTGRLAGIANLVTGVQDAFDQNIETYCPHNNDGQASGAYIFRTCDPNEKPRPYQTTFRTRVVTGPLCQEVRQFVDATNNIHQAFRVCHGQAFVEMTSGIGEVQSGFNGVEVINRIHAKGLQSKGRWFTDSQALEMQERRKDWRPNYKYTVTEPVAANFFPCNAFTYMPDSRPGMPSLAITADRSRATASLNDGEYQFLVQRRLVYDDGRGVGQALDERTRVLSTSRIIFGSKAPQADMRYVSNRQTHYPLMYFQAPLSSRSHAAVAQPQANVTALPKEVLLHSRTVLENGVLIVRLQHLLAKGDEGAAPVTMSIKDALPAWIASSVTAVVETDINAIWERASLARQDFPTCEAGSLTHIPKDPIGGAAVSLASPALTLEPMQIRTFKVSYTPVQ